MNTVILKTVAPFLTSLMFVFSVFVLLRGHSEAGGGFIAGLIAASAIAIHSIAVGIDPVIRALKFHPIVISALGVLMALISGLISLPFGKSFLAGLWVHAKSLEDLSLEISTPLLFDLGVYFVVIGAIAAIILELEEKDIE